MTVKAAWHIVKESAKSIGMAKLAPHDLRRYADNGMSGGPVLGSATPLEASWSRSNFSWGKFRVQTTERYLGCEQRIRSSVNDRMGIEPNP
jgi:hypothetical protein